MTANREKVKGKREPFFGRTSYGRNGKHGSYGSYGSNGSNGSYEGGSFLPCFPFLPLPFTKEIARPYSWRRSKLLCRARK